MISKAYLDLIYLVACGVNQQKVDIDYVKKMDLAAVHRLAKKHLLVVITYMGIESAGISNLSENAQSELMLWKQEKEKGIRKNLLLDIERQKLFTYFEKAGIWYMPLKGSILKDSYPAEGMRQMADNDILFDASFQKEVKDYFVKNDYSVISYKRENHDVYRKKPVYNFEMHIKLYGPKSNKSWLEYYKDVKERLIKDDGKNYGYHFSDEDFYVYMLSHAYKHYDGSGTGLRTLLDIYVCRQKYKEKWDSAYVEAELKKLELDQFEKQAVILADKLFLDSENIYSIELSDKEEEMLGLFADAGTYGTQRISVERKLHKLQKDEQQISGKTKWRYVFERLIPTKEYYLMYQPLIYKLKFPIPFFIVYRIIKGLILHSKKLFREAVIVWRMDKKQDKN